MIYCMVVFACNPRARIHLIHIGNTTKIGQFRIWIVTLCIVSIYLAFCFKRMEIVYVEYDKFVGKANCCSLENAMIHWLRLNIKFRECWKNIYRAPRLITNLVINYGRSSFLSILIKSNCTRHSISVQLKYWTLRWIVLHNTIS